MKKLFWLKAGVYFTLFEGVFWVAGIDLFSYIRSGSGRPIIGLIMCCFSALLFGLFIKYTAKEVKEELKK